MISLGDKILILDGATGTMIQRFGLGEADYGSGPFAGMSKELAGNNECLNLTRPDVIKAIHKEYIAAGADIIETNTFSANRISQAEYECEKFASQMAFEGARIAREAADEAQALAAQIGLNRKVWVAGSMGPTSKSLSLSPDSSDASFRPYNFDQMKEAYREQAEALLRGGADVLLIETCFDALNVKAALAGIEECSKETVPVIISVSVGDRSGRTLTGQTLEAFYTSVKHYPLLAFGLNCSLGASELMPLVEDLNRWCTCGISCYPNAGLPNEMGGYDQSPAEMAVQVKEMASRGLVNIVGGCCGTTPDHIKAIAEAVSGIAPRPSSGKSIEFPDGRPISADSSGKQTVFPDGRLTVSGLEAVTIDKTTSNFTNVGERTNVAGSRKFARLISEGKYDEALQIAAKQIEDGASVIDINMDDAMLDSTREMERFVRCISNEPDVAKAALMIDSSHWDTIVAGLKNAQGKCIVNSISLKEGDEAFIEKAQVIKSFGAAVVVMAFDEEGQATTFDRKIEISKRAYRLLTEKAGFAPSDIIFDVNILSIGTGIEEHAKYAIDFIEAVRWIKTNLPGALTSGGVSNLSFSFRGNNAVREAMHSAFLYHAIKAGLDMAIVNPSMLQVYDEIEPELLKCVEDVIFDTDPQATERLIDKASRMLAEKDNAGNAKAEPHTDNMQNISVEERLKNALVKGNTANLDKDIKEALEEYGSAIRVIEGPLMNGMETVGELFGAGKMFLPQVVKSAKVMRDAVGILEPFMNNDDKGTDKPTVILATVKGDVHDIGKNITGIVLTCNGFHVHDLGVMVDKETIIGEAERLGADMIAVSGLITPSLFQMEEICRDMASRGMNIPLFIGGATTSAVHTAVKLAPLYEHVFYGPDASAAAVMAKKCMMDRDAFENEQHQEQEKIRTLYNSSNASSEAVSEKTETRVSAFPIDTYLNVCPADIPPMEIPSSEILPYFDWKMFYAIWGVRYGSAVPEAMELVQLRRDAEDEISTDDFKIMLTAKFFPASSDGDDICFEDESKVVRMPMMRQENGKGLSLADFVVPVESGQKSPFGIFAISVIKKSKAHVQGCSCPACSNYYEDMIGRTVRMTLAEAASKWLDALLLQGPPPHGFAAAAPPSRGWHVLSATKASNQQTITPTKIIKPAAGYASCPDHTLKGDILKMLGVLKHGEHHEHGHECNHGHDHSHGHGCSCGCGGHHEGMGIELTESYAMTPESSICGLIFMHPEACYPEIRRISQNQYDDYTRRRGIDAEKARRFLGHLLK